MRYLAMMLGLFLAGCTVTKPQATVEIEPVAAPAPPAQTWQGMISLHDQEAINTLPAQWKRALDAVPKSRHSALAAEGALLDPDAALELPALPPGPYHCRLVRLGGSTGLITYKPDFCYVEGDTQRQSFTKQDGNRLFGGWLFDDGTRRTVFMGSVRANKNSVAPAYGTYPLRDVAGVIERVSPFRWRLILTRAGKGALLDVYELVPVTPIVPNAKPAVPKP